MDFRRLPPVTEKVSIPRRLSQSLLARANSCPRSAYLALKYRDGPATVEQDRGTAFHLFQAEMLSELALRGEASLYAPQDGEDGVRAAGEVASLTKAMVEGVLAERRDLVLPAHQREYVRMCAYHAALGLDVDPATVAGIERLFVLDLANGWTISGRVDLLSLPDMETAQVDDAKTAPGPPDQQTFEQGFQLKLYALLVMFGQPVDVQDCECVDGRVEVPVGAGMAPVDCPECDGRGYTEALLLPIGQHLRRVITREVYPYPKPRVMPDGRHELVHREVTWTRQQLVDFRSDVEWVAGVIEHGLQTGDWPARHGEKHCAQCPAEMECPLPRHLRRFAGAIDSVEKASEALVWAERISGRVRATRREVKAFAQASGEAIPISDDKVFAFVTSHSRAVKRKGGGTDWDGLLDALDARANYGTPFDMESWAPIRPKVEFKARDAMPGEIISTSEAVADGDGDDEGTDGRGGGDFGSEPPF